MIDLHNHILPGLDDGAVDVEESLDMARQFVSEGVAEVAATPHRNIEKREGVTAEEVQARADELQVALDEAGVPLRVHGGSELQLLPEAAALLKDGTIARLGKSKAVLVEVPLMSATQPLYMEPSLFDIQLAGFQPVLAHPERYPFIHQNRQVLGELVDRGVVLQLTAPGLLGHHGSATKRTAEALLREGLCAIASSDRHRPEQNRSLADTRERITKLVGLDVAKLMLETNPARLLNDQPVILPPRQERMPGFFSRLFRG